MKKMMRMKRLKGKREFFLKMLMKIKKQSESKCVDEKRTGADEKTQQISIPKITMMKMQQTLKMQMKEGRTTMKRQRL
jgi:hypothetical protein